MLDDADKITTIEAAQEIKMKLSQTQIKALAALALANGGCVDRGQQYARNVYTGESCLRSDEKPMQPIRFMFSKSTARALINRGLAEMVKWHSYTEYNYRSQREHYSSQMEVAITPAGFAALLGLGRDVLAQFDGYAFVY